MIFNIFLRQIKNINKRELFKQNITKLASRHFHTTHETIKHRMVNRFFFSDGSCSFQAFNFFEIIQVHNVKIIEIIFFLELQL